MESWCGSPIGFELVIAAKMDILGIIQSSESFTKILQTKVSKICKI